MTVYSDFMVLMARGGPIMWVIFFIACIAMVMLMWQALRVFQLLTQARRDYHHLLKQNGDPFNVTSSGSASPIVQLLNLIHWDEVNNKDDLAKEINIHLADIMPKLEGGLPTIAMIGSMLPMLGLLGTVMGMINVFDVIAIQGSGNPNEMAHGISQALLTTASGLIIAIPVIFMHHILSQRLNVLLAITGQAMQLVLHRDLEIFKHGKTQ